MDKCIKCPNNLEAILVCLDPSCSEYKTKPFYCMKCSKNHNHPARFIVNEVEELSDKWKFLKNEIITKFPIVKETYQRLEPIILYLE